MNSNPKSGRFPRALRYGRFLMMAACAATALACIDVPEPAPVPASKPAAYPDWWFVRGIIERTNPANEEPVWPTDYSSSDDYAPITTGQLKNLTTQAYLELLEKLPSQPWDTFGTPANALQNLVFSWYDFPAATPKVTGNSDALVNQGQLKNCAKAIYDILNTAGYTAGESLPPSGWTSGTYPWTATTGDDASSQPSNLGMAKYLFSFDLDAIESETDLDTDDDGLPDSWEQDHFSDLDETASGDSDSDGLANLTEYLLGTDPTTADGEVGAAFVETELKVFTPLE